MPGNRSRQALSIIVTGVGGTGVVTIGAILGMAAHLEGKGCGMIDMAGLAQKGGAVFSHVKIAAKPEDIHAIRVAAGDADLVLGCDLVVTGTKKVLAARRAGRRPPWSSTRRKIMPGDFTRNADFSLPAERIKRADRRARRATASPSSMRPRIATALIGDSIAANLFMLGYAYQKGARAARRRSRIEQAIELNGEAVEMNSRLSCGAAAPRPMPQRGRKLIVPRLAPTTARHGFADAGRDDRAARRIPHRLSGCAPMPSAIAPFVERVRRGEKAQVPGGIELAEAVARYLFKLMAYKDEYEVARLYTDGSFAKQLGATFEGDKLRLEFHLAPPIWRKDAIQTGEPRKMSFGPWMMTAFRLLAEVQGPARHAVRSCSAIPPERRTERAADRATTRR